MEFSYTTIKELAKQTGRRVTDLIALAAANDPFYTGTPREVALAEWFADFYHSNFAPGTKVHVRRCHYAIMSLRMSLPNGLPYENTEECWDTLLIATKAARYLRLVDVSAFEDRKNDDPVNFSDHTVYEPSVDVYGYLYTSQLEVPDFPDLPSYSLNNYQASQPYHIELWCEKTTMNDILIPLCQRYNAVLQTGAGELSITATKGLAERIEQSGKPARVFYISDYDPAGQSMPVAVARKLEYFVRTEQLDTDIRLFPVVLTAQQVQRYQLPRAPIKESERRKESFEAQHGQGATELDALEALRPGELQRILRSYIERYYDSTLASRTRQARYEIEQELDLVKRRVHDRYREQIAACSQELEGIRADFAPRMETYSSHIQELWQAMREDMQDEVPTLDDYVMPVASLGEEIGDGLYNSQRSYLDQIEVYKQFQGKQR